MKKIKILMLHLEHGGAEMQTITMANSLAKKYEIEIVSFYKISNNPAYKIDKQIKVKYLYEGGPNRKEFMAALKKLNVFRILKEGLKAVKILYLKTKLIKKEILLDDADIFFSTRYEYAKLLSKYGNKSKLKVTQEHNFIDDEKYKNNIVKYYCNLDYVVVISKYQEKMYKEWFKDSKVRIVRIENILDKNIKKLSNLNNNALIAVGRFDPIKDFISAVEVIKILVKNNPKLKLYLLGDGPERALLEQKVSEYGLNKNVIMPGFVSIDEVYKYMQKSDIFLMTSLKESFSLVILEAYNCGIPVISYDILSGPKELVKNNKTGYLIENRSIEEMALKASQLLNNKDKLKLLGKNAKIESQNYLVEKVMEKWFNLFR